MAGVERAVARKGTDRPARRVDLMEINRPNEPRTGALNAFANSGIDA
jgi:hypothetical protein